MKRIALFVLGLCAALPAAAQEATPTAPAEPVPLFQAACISGAVRLSKKVSEPATYEGLPMAARRALGASTTASRGEAEKLAAPDAASVANTMYRIAGGQLYLLVPAPTASKSPVSESCIVLWFGLSEDDYYLARKLVLPNEETVPMLARPTASAVGASVATSARDGMSLTAATYGGWVALRAFAPNPDQKSPGAQ
jgi:hypothetical protein